MDVQTLSALLETWGPFALLGLLVLTGVGSPIPEDLLLLTTGYLVFTGVFGWAAALVVGLVGVVTSDLLLYSAGRHLAVRSRRADSRVLSPRRLQRATGWFERLGDRLVFAARLTPGTRALVFLTAGLRAMPIGRFVRYDVLGAAIWVPIALGAGYALGHGVGGLEELHRIVADAAIWGLLIVVGLVLAAWLSWGREESKL